MTSFEQGHDRGESRSGQRGLARPRARGAVFRLAPAPLLFLIAAGQTGCGGGASGVASGGNAEAGVGVDPDAGVGPGPGPGPGSIDASLEHPASHQPYPRPAYQWLSETGLFSDMATHTVAAEALSFEPTFKLWSDGATKRRWVSLPSGEQIDTSDMDHWVFPIGTKFWKEFSLDGIPLETRLVERYGVGPEDYWMGAFVWNADQSDATLVPDGQHDLMGSTHDAPAQKECGACHRGDVGRILGFSAIQLSGADPASGWTLRQLTAMDRLSVVPDPAGYAAPGDPVTASALGYLHANCGHCHNKNGTAWPDTQMVLRLVVGDREAAKSGIYRSLVGQKLQYWRGGAIKLRVAGAEPEASAVVARMEMRGSDNQMPPLATEMVDATGLELIRTWIAALPPPESPAPSASP